jgi:DNA-binding GntR family transcriptional regulator
MDHRTKEEQVAELLREHILSGVYPRGSRLKQAEIAEDLGLSITPVREALKLLEAEGYVSRDSYRGARVSCFDAAASEEILELRLLLEPQLVRGAVERLTERDVEDLRSLAREFELAFESGNPASARGLNYRFHRRLYDVAARPHTLHFVEILWARYPFDLINSVEGRGNSAAREHREILDALTRRDEDAAVRAMHDHIESGWRLLEHTPPGGATPGA